jgi:lambda family phage portal protein
MTVLDQDDEDVVFSAPADVGANYEPFQYRTLLRIAAALGVPYFALTGDTSKANYSSLRAALIDARKRIEAFQWSVVIFGMCRPVLTAWVTQAALAGTVPGLTPAAMLRQGTTFRKVRWMLPPWAGADPYKDRQEQILAIQHRLKSRSDVIESDGFDAAETDERIAEDQERERRLGIGSGPSNTVAPRPQPPERDEE